MPNWCEGNIRFRGKKKDIVALIMNEFEPMGKSEIKCNEDMDEIWATDTEKSYGEDFYINGTQRCFMKQFHIYIYDCVDKDTTVCIDGFRAAWSIKPNGFVELAQKYNVDIKCLGFDQGLEFYQAVTFKRDGNKLEEYKEYSDWAWDCPMPNLGG